MENVLLQMMIMEQLHTLFLCALLLFASCAYIAILPWSKEDLEKSHREFMQSFGFSKYSPVLPTEILLED